MRMMALGSQFLGFMHPRRAILAAPLIRSNSRGMLVHTAKLVKASFTESFPSHNFPGSGISATSQPAFDEGQTGKVYVSYSFYKSQVGLTMRPKVPEFTMLDAGGIKLSRQGCLFLEFAPAIAPQQYDWSRKQIFALSVTELGSLLSLSPSESCEFFHDPFKGKSEAGNIRKVLQVAPLPNNSGYFFKLSVSNSMLNVDERMSIPISKAEFAVMQSTFNFILPRLLGWHVFADSIKPNEFTHFTSGKSGMPVNSNFEWDR